MTTNAPQRRSTTIPTPVGNLVLPNGNPELAIRFKQGGRTMYSLVPDVDVLVERMAPPETYDPRKASDKVRNRPENQPHVKAITRYLEDEEEFVLGAIIQYVKPGEVPFIELWTVGRKTVGLLDIPRRLKPFATGDGRHRGAGLVNALDAHSEPGDPVGERLQDSSVPVILIEEARPAKAAQDFVDLGSTKPISKSLRSALDGRIPFNRFCLDLSMELDLFEGGERISYTTDTVAAGSPQLVTFQALRFAIGTLLTGFASRSVPKWNQLANDRVEADWDGCKATVRDIFNAGAIVMPGWREITLKEQSVVAAKKQYASCSAAGLNAFAGAMHSAIAAREDLPVSIRAMATLDWRKANWHGEGPSRRNDVFFEGTIIRNGRTVSSRTDFEAAAEKLYAEISRPLPLPRAA